VIGNDCPECGARLQGDKCRCGWRSIAPAIDDKTPEWQRCQRCGDVSKNTTHFHDDGAPEDRGVRLCAACWIPALRRRAERDPIDATTRDQLRKNLYANLERVAARNISRWKATDGV